MKSMLKILIIFSFLAAASKSLKVGDQAPEFSLLDQDSTLIKLSDYKGKKVVIFFFVKADTPG